MPDRLAALKVFERVAHCGSFSKAAQELRLSQPSISRIVADLETEIGVKLITRSTRGLTLTEAGTDYLARIEPILLALQEADHAARGTGELRGRLRIALSSSFGVREVIPLLPTFLERHPALRVDLVISDARQDLIAEGVDVALRLGGLADSNLIARKLAEAPRMLVASPSYLRRVGVPRDPADLAAHSFIVGPGAIPSALHFGSREKSVSVRIEGRLTVAANEAATAAATAGMGITVTSFWGCRAEVGAGSLVHVLPQWAMPKVELHAVFPPGYAAPVAARVFVDYLAGALDSGVSPMEPSADA